jgi:hypothetical protein
LVAAARLKPTVAMAVKEATGAVIVMPVGHRAAHTTVVIRLEARVVVAVVTVVKSQSVIHQTLVILRQNRPIVVMVVRKELKGVMVERTVVPVMGATVAMALLEITGARVLVIVIGDKGAIVSASWHKYRGQTLCQNAAMVF